MQSAGVLFSAKRRRNLLFHAKCTRALLFHSRCMHALRNVQALFSMTPYIHRTGKESMDRLRAIERIELTLSFVLLCFEREN